MARSRYITVGLFVLLGAIWGTSFVATRAVLPAIPPVVLAALRFDLAGILMIGYAVVTADRWRPRTRDEWRGVLVGGVLFVAAHHALLFTGQQYVTSALAAVIISLDPVLATGFSRYLLPDERLSALGVIGLFVGLIGIGVIAAPSPGNVLTADFVGVTLVFLAAAAFALGAVLTRRYRTSIAVQSMQAWMMIVGAPLLHATAVLLPGQRLAAVQWTAPALAGLCYLAIIGGGCGYLLYFELLDRLGPIEINLVGYVVPVFAAVSGWLVLGERVAPRTVVGFLVIVTGFVCIKHRAIVTEIRTHRYNTKR